MLTHGVKRSGEGEKRSRGDLASRARRFSCDFKSTRLPLSVSPFLPIFIVVVLVAVVFTAGCGSKPTDPRTVIPADAIVYLESRDLGRTLSAITENPRFRQMAKTTPDLSALNGIKVSIAVTGFAASEEPSDEGAVLNFQPRFVAVAETNAWGWQVRTFVEDKLGEVVNAAYVGDVELEISTRNDGSEYYVWSSQEGRKAYALQQGSLVFFGNDESAIERCQAVKRGESDSIAGSPKLADGDRLAFAYVSPEGVGQLANLASLQLAKSSGEEADVQSFVARVLPEILRNTIKDMTWTAAKSGDMIEDRFQISLENESARVFSETIVPGKSEGSLLPKFVAASAMSTTRYSLKDPQIAWRSVVLTGQKKTDVGSGALIAAFSGSVFESYGIEDPEIFLSGIGDQIVTVRLTSDSDDVAVVAQVKDAATVRRGLAKEIDFASAPTKQFDAEIWRSEDGELAAAIRGDIIVVGNTETVLKCLESGQVNVTGNSQPLPPPTAISTTTGQDDLSGKLVEAFSERRDEKVVTTNYSTETRVNVNGIERITNSDFGMIGAIIERIVGDDSP